MADWLTVSQVIGGLMAICLAGGAWMYCTRPKADMSPEWTRAVQDDSRVEFHGPRIAWPIRKDH